MAVGTNHWKLGLFVLLGGALAVLTLIVLGANSWRDTTVEYISYFDESVQGLDVGSPVKFRGVKVGSVSEIGVAPDQRHVAVTSAVVVERLRTLALGKPATGERNALPLVIRPGMRAQLAQSGLSGAKFILIDYFDEASVPKEDFGFDVPDNYLPAMPSTLKRLEDSLVDASSDFPVITQRLSQTMGNVNAMVEQVQRSQLPERAVATFDEATNAVRELNQQLKGVHAEAVSAELLQTLGAVNVTLSHVDQLLAKLAAEDGVMGSVQASMNSVTEVARGAQSLGPDMAATLNEVQSAARSIRRLADALERDPDMLLKGRAVEGQ